MHQYIANVFLGVFILISTYGFTQTESINQYDIQGKRHGEWIKTYKNTEDKRYEGTFEHGKEVGTFKFYKPQKKDKDKKDENPKPAATKTYTPGNDTVAMKFFSEKGNLMSKGGMQNQKREGKWIYYHKNSDIIMMTEHYKNDKLHGWKTVYFPNGKVTEKNNYKNGIKNGESFVYSKNGTLIQHYHYKNGKLHGTAKTYDANGNLTSEGNYKKGMRNGIWKFYENDSLTEEKKYPEAYHERSTND